MENRSVLDDDVHIVLDVMFNHPNTEFKMRELREAASVRFNSLSDALIKLLEENIIKSTEQGFALNEDSDKTNALSKLIDLLNH